jgi:hypothetical protein
MSGVLAPLANALVPIHVVVCVLLLLWDVAVAGRIARLAIAPRAVAAISAVAGLLIVPSLLVSLATSSILYGRALDTISWLWPAAAALVAVQALYATGRRLVNPFIGAPIAAYDTLIAAAAATQFALSHGVEPPTWALAVLAAHRAALTYVSPTALISAATLSVPILTPIFRARWSASATLRFLIAAFAAGWTTLIALEIPRALRALSSYAPYASDRLRERPAGDFAVGIKLLPLLDGPPPAIAMRSDLALADSLGVSTLRIDLALSAVTSATLDSLRRSLEHLAGDSTLLVIALGDRRPLPFSRRPRALDEPRRLAALGRIARALHPDFLLPVVEPYGAAERVHGRLPVERWRDYLAQAAAVVHRVDPAIRVGVSAASYDAADSALYAWAASAESPLDAPGFSFIPRASGARSLDVQLRTADRWMRAAHPTKPQWVWAVQGLPMAHGEANQERALWGALAWATARSTVKGLIVAEAGDYETTTGLRAPDGRLRRAAFALARAVKALRETAGQ